MADLKISQLPISVNPTVNDLLVSVNSGVTKQMTINDVVGLSAFGISGNTSGTCISDIYVSNIHSCSPLSFFNGDSFVASFTDTNEFKLETGVDFKLGDTSRILDSFGDELISETSINLRESNAFGSGLRESGWVIGGGLSEFRTTISGTTSGTTGTTTVFKNTYDLLNGTYKEEFTSPTIHYEKKSIYSDGVGGYLRDDPLWINFEPDDWGSREYDVKTRFNGGTAGGGLDVTKIYFGSISGDSGFTGTTRVIKDKYDLVDGSTERIVLHAEDDKISINQQNTYDLDTFVTSEIYSASGTTGTTRFEKIHDFKDGYLIGSFIDENGVELARNFNSINGAKSEDDLIGRDTSGLRGFTCINEVGFWVTSDIRTNTANNRIISDSNGYLLNESYMIQSNVVGGLSTLSATTAVTAFVTSYDIGRGFDVKSTYNSDGVELVREFNSLYDNFTDENMFGSTSERSGWNGWYSQEGDQIPMVGDSGKKGFREATSWIDENKTSLLVRINGANVSDGLEYVTTIAGTGITPTTTATTAFVSSYDISRGFDVKSTYNSDGVELVRGFKSITSSVTNDVVFGDNIGAGHWLEWRQNSIVGPITVDSLTNPDKTKLIASTRQMSADDFLIIDTIAATGTTGTTTVFTKTYDLLNGLSQERSVNPYASGEGAIMLVRKMEGINIDNGDIFPTSTMVGTWDGWRDTSLSGPIEVNSWLNSDDTKAIVSTVQTSFDDYSIVETIAATGTTGTTTVFTKTYDLLNGTITTEADGVGVGIKIFGDGKTSLNPDNLTTGDFIVRGGTDDNLLVTDASTDKVGIGVASPTAKFHIQGKTNGAAGDSLIVENLSGSDSLIVRDDGISAIGPSASIINGFALAVSGRLVVTQTANAFFDTIGRDAANPSSMLIAQPDHAIGLANAAGITFATDDTTTTANRTFAAVSSFVESRSATTVSGGLVFKTTDVGQNSTSPIERFRITPEGGAVFKPMTASAASAITVEEGLMVMVSDTNGTFTSIGFWVYQNGAWKSV